MSELTYFLVIKINQSTTEQVKTKYETLKWCPRHEKYGGTEVTVSRSSPLNSTPAQCSQEMETNGSRQRKGSRVRFGYDCSIAHQNCVREF